MSHSTSTENSFIPMNHLPWERNKLIKIEELAIFHCHRGKGSITINLENYEMTPHTQVIILPQTFVEVNEVSDNFSVSYVAISTILFREITLRLAPSFIGFIHENPCVTLNKKETKSIRNLLYTLFQLYEDPAHIYQQEIAKNLLQAFVWDVYDKIQRCGIEIVKPEEMNRATLLFKQFIRLVHQYCHTHREVAFYAKELCITPRYLSTVVHQVTGKTTKTIIDRHVLLEIKYQLKTTSHSIQEIAHQLSFPDQSFLGRYFKRHTQMSPNEFRKEK